jgi:chromosomal replication initiation ATPase DnaA
MNLIQKFTFNTYLPKEAESTFSIMDNTIDNNFNDIDCFIIKSSQGNGGTHLLHGMLQRLKSMNKEIICYSAEQLGFNFKTNPEKLENHLMQHQYIGIDDFEFFNSVSIPNFVPWMQNTYEILIAKNKKLLLTITEDSIEDIEIPSFLKKGRMKSIISDFPFGRQFEIVSNVFREEKCIASEEIIKYLCTQNFSSVRAMEGVCISLIAHSRLNNRKIEEMEIEDFKRSYQKSIKRFLSN